MTRMLVICHKMRRKGTKGSEKTSKHENSGAKVFSSGYEAVGVRLPSGYQLASSKPVVRGCGTADARGRWVQSATATDMG